MSRTSPGFGLYDREVVEQFRDTDEQYPYFRGLVSDFGYERAEIDYVQPARVSGKTKNNFFSLYDMAMLGITNHSKVPLRLATMAGFAIFVLALLVAFVYLIAKLMFWNDVPARARHRWSSASTSSAAVQLFFIGVLGEYIGVDSHTGPQVDRWSWRRSASTSMWTLNSLRIPGASAHDLAS